MGLLPPQPSWSNRRRRQHSDPVWGRLGGRGAGIGEDINREGLLETPDRMARMYEEIFGGIGKDAKEILSKK